MDYMNLLTFTTAGAVILMGIAILMHVRKEPAEAHGKKRKFI
jgi:hypothetical protein